MGVYCECAAGQFTGTVPWSDFSDKIKTFRNIARYICQQVLWAAILGDKCVDIL
jgi:hypothetical protein